MERKEIVAMRALCLYGMRSVSTKCWRPESSQHPPRTLLRSPEGRNGRAQASIRYQMGFAKFPIDKDLDRFDFNGTPVDEIQVRDLSNGRFLAEQGNVILVGGTGTGKSHLAVAIARRSETAQGAILQCR